MAMKVVKKTDEYTIFQRGDERYAIKDANKKAINGDAKVRILVEEGLLKVALPPEPSPEAEEEVVEETAEVEAVAEEARGAVSRLSGKWPSRSTRPLRCMLLSAARAPAHRAGCRVDLDLRETRPRQAVGEAVGVDRYEGVEEMDELEHTAGAAIAADEKPARSQHPEYLRQQLILEIGRGNVMQHRKRDR